MLTLYNSLTKKFEEFVPINKNKVLMYCCGPTVYDDTHIGNTRSLINFDVLYRYLRYLGYQVKYIQNITDIDDKIILKAKSTNKTESQISEYYTKEFKKIMKQMNCVKPTALITVKSIIKDIMSFVNLYLKNNTAYETNSGVYLEIAKIKDNYGILSNRDIHFNLQGEKNLNNENKKAVEDFALWKYTTEGLNWNFHDKKGRPGWHTECACIINKFLGKKIDIHCGGVDLVFPHHENEIAQFQCLHKNNLANYWLHNGHLHVNDQKMSKSLNNSIYTYQLLKVFNPNVIRFFILTVAFSSYINFSYASLEQVQTNLIKIYTAIKKALIYSEIKNKESNNNLYMNDFVKTNFEKNMNNNLSTGELIAFINEYTTEINSLSSKIFNSLLSNNFEDGLIKESQSNLYDKAISIVNCLKILGLEIKPVSEKERFYFEKYILAKRNKNYGDADAFWIKFNKNLKLF